MTTSSVDPARRRRRLVVACSAACAAALAAAFFASRSARQPTPDGWTADPAPLPRTKAASGPDLSGLFRSGGGVKDFLGRAKSTGHGNAEVVAFLKSLATESPEFAFDGLARLMPAEDFRRFLESFFKEQGNRDFTRAVGMLAALDGSHFTLAAGAMLPWTKPGEDHELIDHLVLLFTRFPQGSQRRALEDPSFTGEVTSRLWGAQYSADKRAELLANPLFEGPMKDMLAWNEWLNGSGEAGGSMRRASEIIARSGILSDEAVKRILDAVREQGGPQRVGDFVALAKRLPAGHGREAALLGAIGVSPPGDAGVPELLEALPPGRQEEGLRAVTRSLAGASFEEALAGLQRLPEGRREEVAKGLAYQFAGGSRQDDARRLVEEFPEAEWRRGVEKMIEGR